MNDGAYGLDNCCSGPTDVTTFIRVEVYIIRNGETSSVFGILLLLYTANRYTVYVGHSEFNILYYYYYYYYCRKGTDIWPTPRSRLTSRIFRRLRVRTRDWIFSLSHHRTILYYYLLEIIKVKSLYFFLSVRRWSLFNIVVIIVYIVVTLTDIRSAATAHWIFFSTLTSNSKSVLASV